MFSEAQAKAAQLIAQNASTILTGVGAVGTVGTAVLAGRGGYRAAEIIQSEYQSRSMNGKDEQAPELSKTDKLKLTWLLYLPPIAAGGVTVGAVLLAHRISAKEAAALVAAYSISERNFEEYKEKAKEKLGVNKEQKIHEEIAQDRVSKSFNSEVLIIGNGDVLCLDLLTGRYFNSSVERMTQAMAEIHSEIYHHMGASFSSFCEKLDLMPTDYTDAVGWNNANIPEIKFETAVTPDDRPCITMHFTVPPKPDYDRYHD